MKKIFIFTLFIAIIFSYTVFAEENNDYDNLLNEYIELYGDISPFEVKDCEDCEEGSKYDGEDK